ncbi:esterase/lipase family protein [Paraferrimonas haliotis]|uniref:esterase/lipase family protein n=1 Tax=Paraferrimonas haliotis TaxID=2013866 RepID=UPI0015C79FE9|nr:alpha/beta hydrolase [Paraferrimonas haliotis]
MGVRVAIGLMIVFLLSACSGFNQLRSNLDELENTYQTVDIQVEPSDNEAPLLLVALNDANGKEISNLWLVDKHNANRMLIAKSTQYLLAFFDDNGDFKRQQDEPYQLIPFKATSTITIAPSKFNRTQVLSGLNGRDLTLSDDPIMRQFRIGALASIDDVRFDLSQADLGLWQPMEQVKSGITGLYFVDEYNAHKPMVLFVHGMKGSPRNFQSIIRKVQAEGYQVLVYYYPSGLSLDTISDGLFESLAVAQHKYAVKRIHLVAHSMGGLISKAFLNRCEVAPNCIEVTSFTSVSTPFQGVKSAEAGVAYAPVVVPAWQDLQPSSEFIKQLYSVTSKTPHLLVFSYQLTGIINSESSDGVIALSSQLDSRAQLLATRMLGLPLGHVNVLDSEMLYEQMLTFWRDNEPD